jgi:hypothetical protein
MRPALINDERWSSVIWIAAGCIAVVLTFWYPIVVRQQWDSHRALIRSVWFSSLPALWSLGHFIYLLWLCRRTASSTAVASGFLLLLGSLVPIIILATRL